MSRMAQTATAPSALTEQSITSTFHIEVMDDLETSRPTLSLSTDPTLGDLQVVTAAQVVAKAVEQHRLIDKAVRLALDYEAATAAPAPEPHAWTIADRDSGLPLNVTCMSRCNGFHPERADGMARADSVNCTQYDTANPTELLINGGAEEFGGYATLSVEIHSDPVHPDPAKRVPVASIEVVEDHYVEDLDPDALAVVIDKLQERVTAMHVRHADLVRIRNEHARQQA
ncbi:hypothetical protein [Streptomyces sp. NPDC094149]|uniref:DUF6907 domain-containing protein n=1 Tax=Streptomyces sp. NPDC094149 TaxID=3155079 RepID=UPI00333351EF